METLDSGNAVFASDNGRAWQGPGLAMCQTSVTIGILSGYVIVVAATI